MLCSKCGTALVEGAAFCSTCGTSAPKREESCKGCGSAMFEGAKFCAVCGNPLGRAQREEPGNVTPKSEAPEPGQPHRMQESQNSEGVFGLKRSSGLVTLFLWVVPLALLVLGIRHWDQSRTSASKTEKAEAPAKHSEERPRHSEEAERKHLTAKVERKRNAEKAERKWVLLRERGGLTPDHTYYYDPDSTEMNGDLRRVWQLQNSEVNKGINKGSMRSQYEFDCKNRRYRRLGYIIYSERMAGGKIIYANTEVRSWSRLSSQNLDARLMAAVCNAPAQAAQSAPRSNETVADMDWYAEATLGQGCIKKSPAEFIQTMQVAKVSYTAVDEEKIGGVVVQVSLVIPSEGGAIRFYRGKERCQAVLEKKKVDASEEVGKYK